MISNQMLFSQFAGGREGWWDEDVWMSVLKVLDAHHGLPYSPNANPQLFDDITSALAGIGSELSPAGSDESRSVFRASPTAWVTTGVASFNQVIEVSDLGRDVLAGRATYVDCLRKMFGSYREKRNGKNPFIPIIQHLSDGNAHEFESLFNAVQATCGPEMVEWLAAPNVSGFPYKVEPDPENPTRSIRFLLRLLKFAGLVEEDAPLTWAAKDVSVLRQILEQSNFENEVIVDRPDRAIDTGEIVRQLEHFGWQFAPWQVVSYIEGLRTKPFVVLAGISGTGKSKLPHLVSAMTGSECSVIAVRPDWRDSSDLLGYVDLSGRFHPGALLWAAKQAIEDPERQHVVILDEMNLARVEHYFAEILSLIEGRFVSDAGQYRTAPLLSSSHVIRDEDNEPGTAWRDVYLPPNLALVGTVNMDEAGHSFSRRVLDRAIVIEFSEIDLTLLDSDGGDVEEIMSLGAEAWAPESLRLNGHPDKTSPVIGELLGELSRVNQILEPAQLHFGYRLRDEVSLLVLNLAASGGLRRLDGTEVDPIDLAICMKVFPRIQGGSLRVRQILSELEEWAGPTTDPRMAMCSERIAILIDRFDSEGFTSYWL